MSVFTVMAETLGSDSLVWIVFAVLGCVGLLLGRLLGGFRFMRLMDLSLALLIIGILSSGLGARFADSGIAVLAGAIAALLMFVAFIVGTIVPHRLVEVPEFDHAVVHWHPASGRFQAQDHHDLHADTPDPVGGNVDTRA